MEVGSRSLEVWEAFFCNVMALSSTTAAKPEPSVAGNSSSDFISHVLSPGQASFDQIVDGAFEIRGSVCAPSSVAACPAANGGGLLAFRSKASLHDVSVWCGQPERGLVVGAGEGTAVDDVHWSSLVFRGLMALNDSGGFHPAATPPSSMPSRHPASTRRRKGVAFRYATMSPSSAHG